MIVLGREQPSLRDAERRAMAIWYDTKRPVRQIKQDGIRAMVIDSTRDFSNQPGYPRNRVTSLYGAYAFNVCHDLADRLGGRYYGLFDLSQNAIVDTVQREMLRTGSG